MENICKNYYNVKLFKNYYNVKIIRMHDWYLVVYFCVRLQMTFCIESMCIESV